MQRSLTPGPSSSATVAFAVPPNLSEARHQVVLHALSVYLAKKLGRSVMVNPSLSYDDLAHNLSRGLLHAAWLPPALFVELERTGTMRAVAAAQRGMGFGYYSAFFTLVDSDITTIQHLTGHSVGWVDPVSASGYVFPRLQLAACGIDPTTAFQEEVFFRSHEAVVRAVMDRAVDVGATYVHLDPDQSRRVIRAGWRPPPRGVDASSIKWLEPFGPLPADVIAVTSRADEHLVQGLKEAFLDIHEVDEVREAAMREFGTGRFVPFDPEAYDVLRRAMDAAEGKGLEVVTSLRPSTPA